MLSQEAKRLNVEFPIWMVQGLDKQRVMGDAAIGEQDVDCGEVGGKIFTHHRQQIDGWDPSYASLKNGKVRSNMMDEFRKPMNLRQ